MSESMNLPESIEPSKVYNTLSESPKFDPGATHKIQSIMLHDTYSGRHNDLPERIVYYNSIPVGRFQYFKRFTIFVPNHRFKFETYSKSELTFLNKLFRPYGWYLSFSQKAWRQFR